MNTIPNMTGYKATDKNMMCRDTQFALGVWSEPVVGDLTLCRNGYHFCKHSSGVHSYYSKTDTRIFEIEAEDVLEAPATPGADYKLVARRVKLVREITPAVMTKTVDDRHSNTGARNTGFRNTGDCNNGYRNTGDRNTGDGNTGDSNGGSVNTGSGNTGDGNAGHHNTGFSNTGDNNIGCSNTGSGNTGHRNTGDSNTGHDNAGDGNAGNDHSGYFCMKPPTVVCFDVDTGMTFEEFRRIHGVTLTCLRNHGLGGYGNARVPIPQHVIDSLAYLPGFTVAKMHALSDAHVEMSRLVK